MRPFALALGLSLALATAALAQDPIPVSEADLLRNEGWGDREGKTVVLANVKFKDFFRPNVRLVKVPSEKLVLDPDANADLADNLAGWRTSTGALDRKGKSNVRVVGVARDDPSAGRIIVVSDVTRLPGDVEQYTKRAAALGPNDSEGRIRLGDEAKRRADYYGEEELLDWARQTYEQALDIRRQATPKTEPKALIDLALRYRDLAQAPNKAIALLGDLLQEPTLPDAERERAQKLLEGDFQAVQHRGKWVSKEDFKLALGFVARRDGAGRVTWVRRERIEFEQVVTKQRQVNKQDPNPRKLLGSQYEEAANKGEPIVGMYKQEVVRTKGVGFPQYVDRFSDPKSLGELSWDQWVMPDGSRCYFMAQGSNWVLIDFKKKDEPWGN